jgi:hypothetical protein
MHVVQCILSLRCSGTAWQQSHSEQQHKQQQQLQHKCFALSAIQEHKPQSFDNVDIKHGLPAIVKPYGAFETLPGAASPTVLELQVSNTGVEPS